MKYARIGICECDAEIIKITSACCGEELMVCSECGSNVKATDFLGNY